MSPCSDEGFDDYEFSTSPQVPCTNLLTDTSLFATLFLCISCFNPTFQSVNELNWVTSLRHCCTTACGSSCISFVPY